VEILTDEKPSESQKSGELRFYFMPVVPDGFILLIWALSKRFTGYLKGNAGHEKMLTVSSHKGNANQNHTKISPHPY
jgi:hypothetical protein